MKYRVVVITIISALFFCLIMVSASLSPFPSSAKNEFNSFGMWVNVGLILFFYILPLILYMMGVKAMKYVMAAFCGLGLLISFSIVALSFVVGEIANNISDFLAVIILCIFALIINIIWYIVVFKNKKKADLPYA